MTYLVIVCYNCGKLLLSQGSQRSRQCPHCNARLIVAKTRHVASAKSAQEASLLIRAMKQKRENVM